MFRFNFNFLPLEDVIKIISVLFLTLVISSCRGTLDKQKRIFCQHFNELNDCTNKTSLEQMTVCSNNVLQNLNKQLRWVQVEVSPAQKTTIDNSIHSYADCFLSAENEVKGLGAKTEEMESKFMELLKVCINKFAQKARRVLECD